MHEPRSSRSLRSTPTASSRRITTTTNRSACAPRDGTQPLAFQTLGELPAAAGPRPAAVSGRALPRSIREQQIKIAPPLRRAPPGQYSGTRQAHPGLSLKARFRCRFIPNDASAVQSLTGLSMQRLLDPHLTPHQRLFPHRSPRQSSANAAEGGLKPPPEGRLRRAIHPSSLVQHRIRPRTTQRDLPRSWRTGPW